jgi:hypothetical protein
MPERRRVRRSPKWALLGDTRSFVRVTSKGFTGYGTWKSVQAVERRGRKEWLSDVVFSEHFPEWNIPVGCTRRSPHPRVSHPSGIDGITYRYRTNLYTYATLPDGTPISSSPGYFFYVRLSCQWVGPGYVFINDVPGDNQIGIGTTNTTWNLQ